MTAASATGGSHAGNNHLLPAITQETTIEQLKQICGKKLAMNSAAQLERHQKDYISLQVGILSHYASKD